MNQPLMNRFGGGSLDLVVFGGRGDFCEKKKPSSHNHLGGGFKYVLFSPLPGGMIQFD